MLAARPSASSQPCSSFSTLPLRRAFKYLTYFPKASHCSWNEIYVFLPAAQFSFSCPLSSVHSCPDTLPFLTMLLPHWPPLLSLHDTRLFPIILGCVTQHHTLLWGFWCMWFIEGRISGQNCKRVRKAKHGMGGSQSNMSTGSLLETP